MYKRQIRQLANLKAINVLRANFWVYASFYALLFFNCLTGTDRSGWVGGSWFRPLGGSRRTRAVSIFWHWLVPPSGMCLGFHRKLPLPFKWEFPFICAFNANRWHDKPCRPCLVPPSPRLRCGCGCGCTPCGNKYPPTPLLYSSSCALVKCQERNVHFWQFQFIRQPVAATPPPRRRQNLTLNILPPEYPAHMATLTRTPNKTFSTEPKNKVKY